MFRVDRARGPVWYAKYRLPDGRQVQKKLGPAWTERARPPAGHLTKRLAEEWLRDVLTQARRGTLAGQVRTGATFADAAAEWLRYVREDRRRKPSTVFGYTAIAESQLVPVFGAMAVEAITTEDIERWLADLNLSASSKTKSLVVMHGILKRARKVWGLASNAAAGSRRSSAAATSSCSRRRRSTRWCVPRPRSRTPRSTWWRRFTGLRMGELLALRWRDVDFVGSTVRVRASYSDGVLTTPTSGEVRAVPLAPDVAHALAALGRRLDWTGEDDLVFVGEAGGHLDNSALRRRYKAALAAAGRRPLRFHDLRHAFGTG